MNMTIVGGKYGYTYCYVAYGIVKGVVKIAYGDGFLPADSEDEAYGRAVRVIDKAFPGNKGWSTSVAVKRFDHIDRLTPIDISDIIVNELVD